jgi:hypothetical protein
MTFVRVVVAAASIVGAALVTGARRQAPGELPKIAEVVNASTRTVTYRGAQVWSSFTPRAGASTGARGFIGVSFRTGPLRRNHAVQYTSDPEYPWHRLREESPGMYESYADMEAGAWTRMKIEVEGTRARLYVNGASQPCLIVNDIKHGARAGKIALWAHARTSARSPLHGVDRSPVRNASHGFCDLPHNGNANHCAIIG